MVKSSGGHSNRAPKPVSPGVVLTIIVFAVAGQFFLAQFQIPWTLWPGIALMAAALWQFRRTPAPPFRTKPLQGEWGLFALIILLAAFTHFWRLDRFPAGLHQDLGEMGYCALRVLHEGWRPLEEAFQYQTPFLTDFYALAAWFAISGSSLFSIHLYFILMSLAALPVLYLFIRKLAGPSVALWALFFMAVMRLQWVEARNPHPSCEVPLYVLVVIVLLLEGFQNRKPFYLAGAALVAGLGLYAYQSLKVLPLLMLSIALFEYFRFPKDRKDTLNALKWPALVLLLAALPLLHHLWVHHSFGKRESEVFILRTMLSQGSLMPLLRAVMGTALIFNRQGDKDPFHNLPGYSLLDDFTAILFLMGLVTAWRRRKERQGAYPLIGFGIMILPGLLTTEWWAAQRYTGVLPFVAYFAALGTVGVGKALADALKANRLQLVWAAGGFLVLAVAAQNAYTYFGLEAGDPQCQKASGPEQTYIGQEIAGMESKEPGRFSYFLDPFYQHNPTVAFLGYSAKDNTAPFDISDWAQGKMPRDKDSLVFLAQDKSGAWLFLKSLFPHGMDGAQQGPDKKMDLFWDAIPASDLQALKLWKGGLRGIYLQSSRWTDPPVASRLDPLINFSSREDFPFTGPPPCRARWTGRLQVKDTGTYEFIVISTDSNQFWLDGKVIPPEKPLFLSKGFHPLRLEFEKNDGYYIALHLIWKKPDGTYEIVPAEAFGSAQ